MTQRQFDAASSSNSAQASAHAAGVSAAPITGREFYQLRRYNLLRGPQSKLTEDFFSHALMPALARYGMGPVGAFKLDMGPEMPVLYLLIPAPAIAPLAELDLRLAGDKEFLEAAAPFWNATAAAPAFQRVEISLLAAFEGWPKLTPPASSATRGKRIFELRCYENPSNAGHVRKVEMFNAAELDIFRAIGFHPVFFGDTLIGSRMPNLTYMLSFDDMAELEAKWEVFMNGPAWKKLSADPRYAYDQIVTSISNLILSPLACSQI
jgi:hypothetical protein